MSSCDQKTSDTTEHPEDTLISSVVSSSMSSCDQKTNEHTEDTLISSVSNDMSGCMRLAAFIVGMKTSAAGVKLIFFDTSIYLS